MTVRKIACCLGLAVAAVYAGASLAWETRSVIKASRSPSHGAVELGNMQERSVIEGCLRFLGPSDVLAILVNETNQPPAVSPIFIYYRLAYRAYPTRVNLITIGKEDVPAAISQLPRKPNRVLVLGGQAAVPGYEEIARFSPDDVLWRATGEQR